MFQKSIPKMEANTINPSTFPPVSGAQYPFPVFLCSAPTGTDGGPPQPFSYNMFHSQPSGVSPFPNNYTPMFFMMPPPTPVPTSTPIRTQQQCMPNANAAVKSQKTQSQQTSPPPAAVPLPAEDADVTLARVTTEFCDDEVAFTGECLVNKATKPMLKRGCRVVLDKIDGSQYGNMRNHRRWLFDADAVVDDMAVVNT